MSPVMRKKLERNAQYHASMAEHYDEELKKKAAAKEAAAATATAPATTTTNTRSTRATASATPPKQEEPDPDQVLRDLHAEVVKQLQPILATPPYPAIIEAERNRTIFRNASPDLRPSAGVFH